MQNQRETGDGNIRQYTYALDEQNRRNSFDVEDHRWRASAQLRDWVFVLAVLALDVAMVLITFFLEPGMG